MIFLILFVFILSGSVVPAVAEKLPDEELKALTVYPNWVADCVATPSSPTSAGPIYILGDSITEMANGAPPKLYEKKFKENGWSPNIQGLGARQIKGSSFIAGKYRNDGLSQIDKDKDFIKTANVVVVALGTNGYEFNTLEKDVKETVDKVKSINPNTKLYWVNVIDTKNISGSQKGNEKIKQGVGSQGAIIDWFSAAKGKDYFGDKVHPNAKGINALIDLVYESVSSGVSVTGSPASKKTSATQGIEFDAGMAIDNDGIGNSYGDPYHQSQTSYANGRLNADKTNYIALAPGWAEAKGLKLGDIAAVQYKGKTAFAVYGDNYKGNEIHGEGSVALAKALGINPDGVKGGVTSGVHYTVYPGTNKQLNGSVDQSKIDQIGQSLFGGATDTETGGCCPGGNNGDTTDLVGSENLEKIFNFFVQNGFSKEQAAGVVGNVVAESSGSPQRYQGDQKDHKEPPGESGWGIVQWTPPQPKIIQYSKTVNKPAYELSTQLEFLLKQLKGEAPNSNEKGAGDKLKTTKSAEEAATIFQNEYERPASRTASLPKRIAAAKAALRKYSNGSGGVSSGDSSENYGAQQCTCPSGGSSLKDKLEELAKQNGNSTAISVLSAGGTKADASGNDQKPTRSSYKLYTAYATLRAIEEGKISWSTPIWNGRTVRTAMEKMIVDSDNDAATALRTSKRIGLPDKVTKILQNDVGLSNKTIMGTGSPNDPKGTNSQSTANDFTKFLDMLYKKKLPGVKNDNNYSTLIGYMKQSTYNGSRPGMPAGIKGADVADKKGWGNDATNDVGIVYLKGKEYSLAILTSQSSGNIWSGIEKISNEVNKLMSSDTAGEEQGCASAGGGFENTVKQYAWPQYKAGPYLKRQPAYASAVEKAKKDGKYKGGTVDGVDGIDCGGFVTLLMTNSGYEPKYNYDGKGGYTVIQEKWLKENWQSISPSSTKDLKAGDVAINAQHTFVYVGKISGFQYEFASASYSASRGRAPMTSNDTVSDSSYNWYRKK